MADAPAAAVALASRAPGTARGPRRLLLSVDNSDASEAAVRWVMRNLYRPGDELHLVGCARAERGGGGTAAACRPRTSPSLWGVGTAGARGAKAAADPHLRGATS